MKYHQVAVDEVERMLQHSSDLVNLPAMQAESTELSQVLHVRTPDDSRIFHVSLKPFECAETILARIRSDLAHR